MLKAMQQYNLDYRTAEIFRLLSTFHQAFGEMPDSEGTDACLAMGLALKELYGMRIETLRQLLHAINDRNQDSLSASQGLLRGP